MTQTRIVFFDIDGTLIDMHTKTVSAKTVETLQKLQRSGIRICIATGRSPLELPRFGDVEFDAYLTYNGSLCYSGQNMIFSNPIPGEDVQRIIRNAAALGKPVAVATSERIAANGWAQDLADYYAVANLTLKAAPDFDKVARQEVYQLMLGCRAEEYPAVMQDVTGAKITAWWDRAVDIIPMNGGKGMGIQKILKYFRLDRGEAMAFGDGNNDIEMLEAVGTGIAMENASDRLKAVADDICGHAAQDGIYHYCKAHGLI